MIGHAGRCKTNHHFDRDRNEINTESIIILVAYPDVIRMPLVPETHEFILLACDGIWDVMTNQEVRGKGKKEGGGIGW